MPIATPEVYAQMLDTAKQQGFAFPAINVTSTQTLNAALQGFAEAKRLGGGKRVLRRTVQLLVHLADDAVFLTADDADLELHDDAGPGALLQEVPRDLA